MSRAKWLGLGLLFLLPAWTTLHELTGLTHSRAEWLKPFLCLVLAFGLARLLLEAAARISPPQVSRSRNTWMVLLLAGALAWLWYAWVLVPQMGRLAAGTKGD